MQKIGLRDAYAWSGRGVLLRGFKRMNAPVVIGESAVYRKPAPQPYLHVTGIGDGQDTEIIEVENRNGGSAVGVLFKVRVPDHANVINRRLVGEGDVGSGENAEGEVS